MRAYTRPVEPAGRLSRSFATYGDRRSTFTLRPLPLVKKTIFATRARALPAFLRIVTATRRRPPGGVHCRPASKFTSPICGALSVGGAGGVGTATAPRLFQAPQAPVH